MQLIELTQRLSAYPNGEVLECIGSGIRKRTFPQLKSDVEAATERLQQSGVRVGMRIGLLAENCYEWIVFELAIVEMRCITVALVDEIVQQGLEEASTKYGLHLIVTDRCPADRPALMLAMHEADASASARNDIKCVNDPQYATASWVFSSGSSGRTKVIQTQRVGIEQLVNNLPTAFELIDGDRFLVFLPMASFQQRFLIYGCLWNGVDLVITQPKFLFQVLKQCPPTILLAPPAFYSAIAAKFQNLSPWRQMALKALHRIRELIPYPPLQDALIKITSRPLYDVLGSRVRLMITGMAPISLSTLRLFDQIGLPVYEVYGMTECGMIAWNTPRARRLGSVGRPLNDAVVSIADDGEVLVSRTAQPTVGYLFEDSDEDQASTYRGEGTIATGDIGYIDADGFLYLRGRKKNIIVTAGGLKLHPESIEERINGSPDIDQSAVFATNGSGLTAVIVARAALPERQDRIRRFIAEINRDLSAESQLLNLIFSSPFTPENSLLTANLKLNRKAIEASFNAKAENAA